MPSYTCGGGTGTSVLKHVTGFGKPLPCVCVCVCVCMNVCMSMYVYMYVCMYEYMYVCIGGRRGGGGAQGAMAPPPPQSMAPPSSHPQSLILSSITTIQRDSNIYGASSARSHALLATIQSQTVTHVPELS